MRKSHFNSGGRFELVWGIGDVWKFWMIQNWSKISMNYYHLRSIWYPSDPWDVPYSPNQFLGWDFFWRFLQQDGSSYFITTVPFNDINQLSIKRSLMKTALEKKSRDIAKMANMLVLVFIENVVQNIINSKELAIVILITVMEVETLFVQIFWNGCRQLEYLYCLCFKNNFQICTSCPRNGAI